MRTQQLSLHGYISYTCIYIPAFADDDAATIDDEVWGYDDNYDGENVADDDAAATDEEDWGYDDNYDGEKVADDDAAATDDEDWGYLIPSPLGAGPSCARWRVRSSAARWIMVMMMMVTMMMIMMIMMIVWWWW